MPIDKVLLYLFQGVVVSILIAAAAMLFKINGALELDRQVFFEPNNAALAEFRTKIEVNAERFNAIQDQLNAADKARGSVWELTQKTYDQNIRMESTLNLLDEYLRLHNPKTQGKLSRPSLDMEHAGGQSHRSVEAAKEHGD
jgi:hypothetical protein